MNAQDRQALVGPWPWADVQTEVADMERTGHGDEAATLLRAWFASHREELILACFPEETRWGNRAGSRAVLQRRFREVAPAAPGRVEHRVCEEMYRGCAKTASARFEALVRLIYHLEHGALFVNHTAPMATPHSEALQAFIPRANARSPTGNALLLSLFPGLTYTGSVTDWTMHIPHLPGLNDRAHDAPVFAGGISGNLRGFLSGFVRPTMLILDDVETADSARSPSERESVRRAITEEAAGIAPQDIGLYSLMLCNALALEDAGAFAESDPGWIHDRVAIWQRAPEETSLVRELEALWHATAGPPAAKNAAVAAHPCAAEIETLAVMDDPDRTVLSALCLRWSEGRRPFARNRECLRTSHGERTFEAQRILLCDLGAEVIRADGSKVALSALHLSIFLDPRFSKNEKKNDYAAIVAVAKDGKGVKYTLDGDAQRDRGTATRMRMWAMLDRLLALGADPRKIKMAYETNSGAEGTYEEPFDADIAERRRVGKFAPTVTGRYSPSTRIKLDEIEAMEDPLHSGQWQIARHLVDTIGWHQLLAVPHGQHDDWPDAMKHAGDGLDSGVNYDEWFGPGGAYG